MGEPLKAEKLESLLAREVILTLNQHKKEQGVFFSNGQGPEFLTGHDPGELSIASYAIADGALLLSTEVPVVKVMPKTDLSAPTIYQRVDQGYQERLAALDAVFPRGS